MNVHLFVLHGGRVSDVPAWVQVSPLPEAPAAAARAVESVLETAISTVVFWDPKLGVVPWRSVERFQASRDDVWHPGARARGADDPDLLRYVLPLWVYRPDPVPELAGAINWKLTFRAAFVRADALRSLGGLAPDYETLAGVSLDLGFRMLHAGGVLRQRPDLISVMERPAETPSLADRYRLLARSYCLKWLAYTALRRITEGNALAAEVRALRAGGVPPAASHSRKVVLQRPLEAVELPVAPSVSVVLPTFGRYRYLGELLDDVRAQTVKPTQILIADGNPPEARDAAFYERYRDLPIEVLWHDEPGTCSGRNACL